MQAHLACCGVVAWGRFQQDFPDEECRTLIDCVSFTLNFGMRAGGGIGDVISGGSDSDGPISLGFGRMVWTARTALTYNDTTVLSTVFLRGEWGRRLLWPPLAGRGDCSRQGLGLRCTFSGRVWWSPRQPELHIAHLLSCEQRVCFPVDRVSRG